jgi:hypothetical protein
MWDKYKLYRLLKDPHMINKLKSRKLWVTVITAALLALGQGLGVDPELMEKLVTMAVTYVGAQSLVDAAGALKQG